jgi:hypothetical protein
MWLRRLWVVVVLAALGQAGCCCCRPHGVRRHCFYPSDAVPAGAAVPSTPAAAPDR